MHSYWGLLRVNQWGQIGITDGAKEFTFPIAFSTRDWSIGICGTSLNSYSISESSRTNTGGTLKCGDNVNTHLVHYIALGI